MSKSSEFSPCTAPEQLRYYRTRSSAHPLIVLEYLLQFLGGFLSTHALVLLALEKRDKIHQSEALVF